MIRFAGQALFRMSTFRHDRNIFVNDPSSFDILINDIPKSGLKHDVSGWLHIPYLSKYEGSIEKLKEKAQYEGSIIGSNWRLFFSIPTAKQNSSEYYNVHYLLDTGSPYTTLTH